MGQHRWTDQEAQGGGDSVVLLCYVFSGAMVYVLSGSDLMYFSELWDHVM